MKSINQMTLDEIHYLIHVHEFASENERRAMFNALADMRSMAEMIA